MEELLELKEYLEQHHYAKALAVYEVDETEYLTRSEANKRRLLAAIENVEKGDNLVEINFADLQGEHNQ